MTGILRGAVGPEVTALVLPEAVRREIQAEARRAHPQECCGLLVGRIEGQRGVVTACKPSPNRAADPHTTFEIDPALLLETQRRLRPTGEAVLGHYHSHPQGPAEPSKTDRERAWVPGHVWLIAAPDGSDWGFAARLAVERGGRVVLSRLGILAG